MKTPREFLVYPNPTFVQAMATSADMAGKVDKVGGKALSSNDFTNELVIKLAGIAEQATKNATDAQLRARSTHSRRSSWRRWISACC